MLMIAAAAFGAVISCSGGHQATRKPTGAVSAPASVSPLRSTRLAPTPSTGTSAGPAIVTSAERSPGGSAVGIARIDLRRARLSLLGGSAEPGEGSGDGQVPLSQRSALLAAFNGGFLLRQAHGGLYLSGRVYRPLTANAASIAVRKDGTAVIGAWGRDVTMTPDVVAVRQNLELLVDHSAPASGLDATDIIRFGATLHHRPAVPRSALCIAADGTLIYAGGPALTALDLAQTMIGAGCARAMELDINPQFVVFVTYQNTGGTLAGTRLLPTMHYGPDRFLNPQPRDFFSVFARP